MKIQKQLSKKRGDKIYHKHVVVIPNDVMKEAGLKGGDEVEVKASKGKIVLKNRVRMK